MSDGLIDFLVDQNRKSGLQDWAQTQYGQTNPGLASLAQADPDLFRTLVPTIAQHQLEQSAINNAYGTNPQNAQLPQGVPLDSDTALPSQTNPQPPQSAIQKLMSNYSNLPPALQATVGQQMMFQGVGNSTDASGANTNIHGDDFLKSLNPSIASQVKGLASGSIPFPSSFALKSPYWQQMLSAVSQYDPTFDAVNYQARAATRKDFTSGKEASQVNALNTVAEHLAALKQTSDDLHNGDYPALNAVENWTGKQIGSDAKTNYDNVLGNVAEELTRVYRQAGGSESDINRYIDNMSSSSSPQQFKGAFQNIGELLKGKIDALQDQYHRGMGTAANDTSFYSPQAVKAFQSVGLDLGNNSSQPSALSQIAAPQITPEQARAELARRKGQK